MCPSYPFTLESHQNNLLLYRCGVCWSTVGNKLPELNSASGLYTHKERHLVGLQYRADYQRK